MQEKLVAAFSEIQRTEIEEEELLEANSEGDFIGVLVDLMIEAGSYLVCSASIYPSGREGWTRNEAVVGGHLVRLYKLVDAILDQTTKHRRETSFILARLHFETAINAIYFMKYPTDDLFNRYVEYSLHFEKNLRKQIETNVTARGGEPFPIEERMLASIDRAFDAAEIDATTLSTRRPRDWARKNLRERAEEIGYGQVYLGVFSNASTIVHGNWGDLYQHHLEKRGDRFFAKTDFAFPRPQILETSAVFSVVTVANFIDFLGLFQERSTLGTIFDDFEWRVRELSRIHEAWLNARET